MEDLVGQAALNTLVKRNSSILFSKR